MGKFKDLTNQRFGKLIVLNRTENDRQGNVRWLCRCDCGETSTTRSNALIHGKTLSCGCYGRKCLEKNRLKHGLSEHPLYHVWSNMLQRCYNTTNPNYKHYGGRDIKVSIEWKNNPVFFIKWGIDNGWSKGLQLDRIDNDGSYTPYNCQFVSPRKNMSNTRIQKRRDLPTGVVRNKNKFRVNISFGSYDTPSEARNAYLEALKQLNLGD